MNSHVEPLQKSCKWNYRNGSKDTQIQVMRIIVALDPWYQMLLNPVQLIAAKVWLYEVLSTKEEYQVLY